MTLHQLVQEALPHNIDVLHEARVAPRCRIDFLAGDVGIEIKRGKLAHEPLLRQFRDMPHRP